MADSKLSALAAATGIGSTDELYVNDGGISKKVSNITIADGASVSGSNTGDEDLTASGTGNLVRVSDATLVAPALGTPASGVMTNVTGIPVAALANGTDGELITWDAAGVAATVPVGTATHVLTSNGAGAAPTFQAAAGGSTIWESLLGGKIADASIAWTLGITGSGVAAVAQANCAFLDTSATANSGSLIKSAPISSAMSMFAWTDGRLMFS